MADRIRVNIEQLEQLASQVKNLRIALNAIESDIRSIRIDRISGSEVKVRLPSGTIESAGRSMDSGCVTECLKSIAACVRGMESYTGRLSKNIGNVTDKFIQNEKQTTQMINALGTPQGVFEGLCTVLGYSTDRSTWTKEMHKKYSELVSNTQVVIDGGLTFITATGMGYILGKDGVISSYEMKESFGKTTHTTKIYDGNKIKDSSLQYGLDTAGAKYKNPWVKPERIGQKYDKDGNPLDMKEYYRDGKRLTGKELAEAQEANKQQAGNKIGLATIGASYHNGVSALGTSGAYETERFKAQGSAGVGNADFDASIAGGLGVYVYDENGNKELYVGGEAKIGASVSAAEASGSLEYELLDSIDLKAGVQGDVAVLKGGANAGAGAGIVGGEAMLYAEAEAEFNLVEADASASVEAFGVKGTAGIGASVGVGAHAKVGYRDGVVAVDVGASLGLGVSFNCELDVSGVVDFATGAAESIGEFLSDCAWW